MTEQDVTCHVCGNEVCQICGYCCTLGCKNCDCLHRELQFGDLVETAVFVGHKRIPMHKGRIVAVHAGYCDVDHCYPYAAPWIWPETNASMRLLSKDEIKELLKENK